MFKIGDRVRTLHGNIGIITRQNSFNKNFYYIETFHKNAKKELLMHISELTPYPKNDNHIAYNAKNKPRIE